MKLICVFAVRIAALSLPVRGAWIEIFDRKNGTASDKSLPVRGAWIEIRNCAKLYAGLGSLPVRGAWIEIVNVIYTKLYAKGRSL